MRLARAALTWARRWAYTAAQLGLALLAWAYLLVFAASMLLMVLIVGLLIARALLPLARLAANWSLRAAQWARRRGETAAIAADPGGHGLAAVVTALLRSPQTWKAVAYLLVNALLLPVHAGALLLFPLAGLWARADAWFTVRFLGSGPETSPSPDAVGAAGQPGAGDVRRGFGLTGMAERVAALGGRLSAGPDGAGGFVVRAVLPLPAPGGADGAAAGGGAGAAAGGGDQAPLELGAGGDDRAAAGPGAADGGADGAALELGAGGDDWAAAGPGDHRAVDRRAAEREVTAGANRAHGIGGVVTGGVRGATGTAEAGRERP